MSKVALVTHDVQTIAGRAGGVAAFVTHFARLLRGAGEEVTIVVTRQETDPVAVDASWRNRYEVWGIELVELHNTPPSPARWSDPWTARLSELVAPHLSGFDIAYFQDWANVAFLTARRKRFSREKMPVLVTVLHGPSGWLHVGNRTHPQIPEDLHLDYIERYSAKFSDFVAAPSRYMADWLRANGWEFRQEPAALGLPYLSPARTPAASVAPVTRLIFFGRLETRKGFSMFVSALRQLSEQSALEGVTEIVFLGAEQEPGAFERVRRELAALAIPIVHVGDLDSDRAQDFLTAHAADSLVVVPSPAENFPYAVIEASSLPGLHMVCSQGGGVPEIFGGRGGAHLFEPHPRALAAKIREHLASPSPTPAYDAEAANARWLQFHREALAPRAPEAQTACATAPGPKVDVCIPYFNKGEYLPALLAALEQQTAKNFGVIVVDDGSDAGAKEVFDSLAQKHSGWTFVTQPNSFVDAARNRAASLSHADYLFFIDADDLPAPNAVERMLEAIALSGDDCLVAGGLLINDNGEVLAQYMPLGPDLVCALADPMVLGPSMILVRRRAFEQIGGYRTVRGAAHEDWELQIRLVMAGFRVDVLPEFLLSFRKTEGGLSLTSCEYEAKRRLIETYEDALAKAGLRGVAGALVALGKRCDELELALRSDRARRVQGLVEEMLRRRTQSP